MKRSPIAAVTMALSTALFATLAATAWAQDALPQAQAEVRRVDTRANTVTLRHGDIKNLDMPPMTMVFQVKDPAWLQRIKAGDKVHFTADKVGGNYTVLSIEPTEAAAAAPPAASDAHGHKH